MWSWGSGSGGEEGAEGDGCSCGRETPTVEKTAGMGTAKELVVPSPSSCPPSSQTTASCWVGRETAGAGCMEGGSGAASVGARA